VTISYTNYYVYKEILCYYDLKVKKTIFIKNDIVVIICKCRYNVRIKYVVLEIRLNDL
jgi:hypothetical protein